jgi:hypothetical protein
MQNLTYAVHNVSLNTVSIVRLCELPSQQISLLASAILCTILFSAFIWPSAFDVLMSYARNKFRGTEEEFLRFHKIAFWVNDRVLNVCEALIFVFAFVILALYYLKEGFSADVIRFIAFFVAAIIFLIMERWYFARHN